MKRRFSSIGLSAVLITGILVLKTADAVPIKNGFDLYGSLVPSSEIVRGGPPRDGIPALTEPKFTSAAEGGFLSSDARVLGIERHGVAKAYPIAILNWHEVVNDEIGGEAIAVTYCPLCGSGMAYQAALAGSRLTFGVSGLLYNSDVLFYDHETESLWSQLGTGAVTGPLRGQRLTPIALSHTTWADWSHRHPDTLVLSRATGFQRDYDRDPYAGEDQSPVVRFRVSKESRLYPPKEWVLGVEIDGRARAYAFSRLAKFVGNRPGTFDDIAGDKLVRVHFDPEHRTGWVRTQSGEEIPSVITYWFAWYAFHPDTSVFPTGP